MWERKTSGDQKVHVIGVVVGTKNQDNSIVPPSAKDAIIAASSGIFLGFAAAGEVNLNGERPTS